MAGASTNVVSFTAQVAAGFIDDSDGHSSQRLCPGNGWDCDFWPTFVHSSNFVRMYRRWGA